MEYNLVEKGTLKVSKSRFKILKFDFAPTL